MQGDIITIIFLGYTKSIRRRKPNGRLLESINNGFESFENFKEEFSKAAATRFGSGWAWLCVHENGTLKVCSTANQDNPLMPGIGFDGFPILGIDVWGACLLAKLSK